MGNVIAMVGIGVATALGSMALEAIGKSEAAKLTEVVGISTVGCIAIKTVKQLITGMSTLA